MFGSSFESRRERTIYLSFIHSSLVDVCLQVINGDVISETFQPYVAETNCIARIFRRELERETGHGNFVPVSRYSTRVPCKRDSDQTREREKFSAGSWNVVRTDVTRTANYLRMFRLRRVSRSLPICIIIGRTFNAGGSNRPPDLRKQSRSTRSWPNFL